MKFSAKYLYLCVFLLLSLLGSDCGVGNAKLESSPKSLTKHRIVKELRDICQQELLPCFPFNGTSDEVGVRLIPTASLLEWHFSFTGIEASPYEGGVYHGRILLPKVGSV